MSTSLVSAVSVSGEMSGGRGAALTPAFASDCSASASVTTLRTAIPACIGADQEVIDEFSATLADHLDPDLPVTHGEASPRTPTDHPDPSWRLRRLPPLGEIGAHHERARVTALVEVLRQGRERGSDHAACPRVRGGLMLLGFSGHRGFRRGLLPSQPLQGEEPRVCRVRHAALPLLCRCSAQAGCAGSPTSRGEQLRSICAPDAYLYMRKIFPPLPRVLLPERSPRAALGKVFRQAGPVSEPRRTTFSVVYEQIY